MQDTQLNAILNFAPYVGFILICLVLYLFQKMTFKVTLALIGVTGIARTLVGLHLHDWGGFWAVIIQLVIGVIVFVGLVFFVSNASWETLLIMSSMLAFTPIPDGVFAFLGTYVLLIIYGIITLDYQEVKRVMYDALVSSGFGAGMPNYEHLPTKELKTGQKRITLLPFILIAYTLNALYYILSPYFLES